MPKGYLVVFYLDPPSPENLAAYAAPAKAAMEGNGGTFIARGVPVKSFEAGRQERSVIIEFESPEAAIKAYEDEAYQALLPNLGVLRDMRVIEGT